MLQKDNKPDILEHYIIIIETMTTKQIHLAITEKSNGRNRLFKATGIFLSIINIKFLATSRIIGEEM